MFITEENKYVEDTVEIGNVAVLYYANGPFIGGFTTNYFEEDGITYSSLNLTESDCVSLW